MAGRASPVHRHRGKILFNVYAVKKDCFNQVFPGEPLLPKLGHYHVKDNGTDFERIKRYFFSPKS